MKKQSILNGQIMEHYFLPPELEAAKKINHPIFEKWRDHDLSKLSSQQMDEYIPDEKSSRERYNSAWNDFLNRTGQTERELRASLMSESLSGVSSRGVYPSNVPLTERPTPLTHLPLTRETVLPTIDSKRTVPSSLRTKAETLSFNMVKPPFKESIDTNSIKVKENKNQPLPQTEIPKFQESAKTTLEAERKAIALDLAKYGRKRLPLNSRNSQLG